VRISWKFLPLSLLAAFSLLLGGCGGISASRSVSPLDFLLPGVGGFLKADPMPTNAPGLFPKNSTEVAFIK
jgi:hypothetical protein